MDSIWEFLQTHWQWVVIIGGAMPLLGAIFNWDWICNPAGSQYSPMMAAIKQNFGINGYRALMGLVGVVMIACGVLFLFIKVDL